MGLSMESQASLPYLLLTQTEHETQRKKAATSTRARTIGVSRVDKPLLVY